MKKLLPFLILLLMQITSMAQEKNFTILGKVVDSATQQVLQGASAYCQNTTQGTITNKEGLFFLRLPNGGYDLVISFMGYEKKVIRISNNLPPVDTMQIALLKEEKSLAEVAVVASTELPDGLARYGQFFIDHFIGTSPNASQCVIKNPEALKFYFFKKRNRLKVTAREDIIITNEALGYNIRYQLDSFSYDYNNNISQYTGYPLFMEIDTTAEVRAQYGKNRARTYLGSRLHFMRTLFDSTMLDEGFVVEKMEDDPKSAKGSYIKDIYSEELYEADSSEVFIKWQGRYRITYKNVHPDKRYLQDYKLPDNIRVQVSLLDVADGFVIEENGYFYDQQTVISTGYWAWKLLAELLPYDYEYH
ncbi:carboxypeptidase-like regulatory domain-containing protein [Pseudobacter ginsenosidimutans]|uniref:Carboxypeptidase-like protein n=1 Tax=Pseudobacter ginsenosidimutans TaxID=661488 RepID=A0A4Q7MVP8_9BACT|nr:carboxypeptidase-like regulatory domain-containing protein [Pseudobacter ginsenosidimutans]QEC41140.1 carboxypeptidase-like regulatory domain-containing protein [Pseudobacter ginsenosidimutans]RZS72099.1 carboxypeptidase-like protein [Pseudobacter ginsenosidimutans]